MTDTDKTGEQEAAEALRTHGAYLLHTEDSVTVCAIDIGDPHTDDDPYVWVTAGDDEGGFDVEAYMYKGDDGTVTHCDTVAALVDFVPNAIKELS